MKKLYDEIVRRFPEVDVDEEDIKSPYLLVDDVLFWLQSKTVNCADPEVIERIVAFRDWCNSQEEAEDAGHDISTIYVVGFFEGLFKQKKTRILIPHLTTRQELIENRRYLISWCGLEEYDEVLNLMKK